MYHNSQLNYPLNKAHEFWNIYIYKISIYIYTPALPFSGTNGRYIGTTFFSGANSGIYSYFYYISGTPSPNPEIDFKSKFKNGGYIYIYIYCVFAVNCSIGIMKLNKIESVSLFL